MPRTPRPPRDLAWWAIGHLEEVPKRLGVDLADFWDYATMRKPTPPEIENGFRDFLRPLEPPSLPSRSNINTLDTMNASDSSNALRSRARISAGTRKHKGVQVLARKGVTFGAVSDKLTEKLKRKVPRSTVQAWFKEPTDPAYRAIPEDACNALNAEYGIPKGAWARIIPAI